MRKGYPFILAVFILTLTVFNTQPSEGGARQATNKSSLTLVAHAGAAIEGYPVSNSLEALKNAISLGFRYIELDMITTSDSIIVLNHSWPLISNRIPGIRNGIMTHAEFMSQRIYNQFTPVDLNRLIEFLQENPGPRIITDTKDTDYAALYVIARFFPEYRYRFIPQAYAYEDVARIRALGFGDVILTTYMMTPSDINPATIHRFALAERLYGVAIHEPLATLSFVSQLNMNEMRYMVFTIDSKTHAMELYSKGFYAVYTAFLAYTNDLKGIMEVPLPIHDYVSKINSNIQSLNNTQLRLMSSAMFYKIDVPVYVHRGGTIPVTALNRVAAPFISPISGKVYLRAGNFTRYIQGLDWNTQEQVLYILKGEDTYVIGQNNLYELFLYRDTAFISETIVRDIINFEVLQKEDYIVVVSKNSDQSPKDLFEIAKILFADA